MHRALTECCLSKSSKIAEASILDENFTVFGSPQTRILFFLVNILIRRTCGLAGRRGVPIFSNLKILQSRITGFPYILKFENFTVPDYFLCKNYPLYPP